MKTIYEEKGFKDRSEYLESLCEEYDFDTVYMLAELFGPTEDFDGLLTSLDDAIL